jgi:hypothetical protein
MTARAAFFALGLGVLGCYDDHHRPHHHDVGPVTDCDPGVLAAGIDRGGYLDLAPGLGAGATVEYAGDGFWRFATTCDTSYSGYACVWDIQATPLDAPIYSVSPEGLESTDTLSVFTPERGVDTASFVSRTTSEIDAFTLETDPGAPVEIDALLDSGCGGPFVSWIDDGYVTSSPTRVMELYPRDP